MSTPDVQIDDVMAYVSGNWRVDDKDRCREDLAEYLSRRCEH